MQSIKTLFKTGYGPSSSHTIGPTRATLVYLDYLKEHNIFEKVDLFEIILQGSLAATGRGHNTDEAILKAFKNETDKKVEIKWDENFKPKHHPNGFLFNTYDSKNALLDSWQVYSVGGGEIKDFLENSRISEEKDIYPLTTMTEILDWCHKKGSSFWEYVQKYDEADILDFLKEIWENMKNSIKTGLETEGVLPGPLHVQRKAASYHTKALMAIDDIKNKGVIFSYALAVSEHNASGGKIVTAPTCGASGVLPATLYFAYKIQNQPESRILRALAIAGLIGNIVKTNGSISGAEVGCQGEIGTACAMGAGAMVYLLGGSSSQIEYAAEMGFEHHLGLTCDPVMGFVQIPCIERNAFGADKARESAVFACFSDGAHKISFDQVVNTMLETGRDLQSKYRETGKGGLARHWENMDF